MRSLVDIRITRFQPAHAEAFASLNRAWLVENGLLTDTDEQILADPIGRIIEPGGHIFVALQDDQVIGTCALLPHGTDAFELAKLTVARAARGHALGRRLVEAALAFTREQGRHRVMLLSNTRMVTAVRLYEALGFRHRSLPADVKYAHADVCMEILLVPDGG